MLFSNVQDEAILSERNEQEMFQSQSSEEEEDSNDRIAQEEDADLQPKESQTPSFSDQQIIKEETKKKDIKDTCLEKIKSYIGFGRGELILNEKIGSIFLLPISSNWTFKMQVTITQIIIAVTCFTLFIGIQFIGQNVLFNSVQLWTNQNISQLLTIQMFEATIEFIQLIINTTQNERQLIRISLDLLLVKNLSYVGKIYTMDSELPNSSKQYLIEGGITDSYTFDFATYTILNENNISDSVIRSYVQLNYIMKYNYQTFASMIFWVFDDGFTMQYPGVNVTNLEKFKQYRKLMYESKKNITNISIEYTYDIMLKQFLQREVQQIFNEDNEQIGLVFCERQPFILYLLFYQNFNNSISNFTLFLLTQDNSIVYIKDEEYTINKQELQNQLYTLNSSNSMLHKIDKEQILKILYKEKTYYSDLDLSNYFDVYWGEMEGKPFLLSYINFEGLVVGIYQPTHYYLDLIFSENQIFDTQIDMLNRKLIPLALAIPFIYIILCVFYMIQQIKPLQKVTEFADQLLKKSQNFDEKQVEESDGNGLIQQLASLFKKLMINLNKSKQIKKQEIIEFYNKQTYPKNQKARDVTEIIKEIENIDINQLDKDLGVLQFPNLDD